jgi:hypothetical protein
MANEKALPSQLGSCVYIFGNLIGNLNKHIK